MTEKTLKVAVLKNPKIFDNPLPEGTQERLEQLVVNREHKRLDQALGALFKKCSKHEIGLLIDSLWTDNYLYYSQDGGKLASDSLQDEYTAVFDVLSKHYANTYEPPQEPSEISE